MRLALALVFSIAAIFGCSRSGDDASEGSATLIIDDSDRTIIEVGHVEWTGIGGVTTHGSGGYREVVSRLFAVRSKGHLSYPDVGPGEGEKVEGTVDIDRDRGLVIVDMRIPDFNPKLNVSVRPRELAPTIGLS